MTITKEFIPFMENKTRGVKAYTNIEGTEILVVDPNNFYKGEEKGFKADLEADLLSHALLCGDYAKLPKITDAVQKVKITFVI